MIARSGSLYEDLQDPKLLASAVADVQAMQLAELESFVKFWATCDLALLEPTSIQRFECERERNLYLLKYARARSIDRIVLALSHMDRYIAVADKAKPSRKDREQISRYVDRIVSINDAIRSTTNSRFRALLLLR